MGPWGAIVAITGVLALGASVMVFKQHVDADERRLEELRGALAAAEADTARLTAELAYHQRPAYVMGFADRLGLTPANVHQTTALAALPPRPDLGPDRPDGLALVALRSGALVTIRRRPDPLQIVGLAP
jgi:hypothetical protein